MTLYIPPDPETTTKAYLQTFTELTDLIGTNISTTLPTNPPMPYVVIQLVSTSPIGGDANVSEYWLQIDVYAGKNDYATASKVKRIIQSIFFDTQNDGATAPNSGETAVIYGARVNNERRIPEPMTEWARFALDVLITMRAS